MALHVDGRAIKPCLSQPVVGRAYAGELDEITNEMGLVEVSAIHGDLRPIDDGGVPRQRDCVLKPPHTSKELRSQSDLAGKDLDQACLAQVHCFRDVTSLRLSVSGYQHIHCLANSAVADGEAAKTFKNIPFQQPKPLHRLG